MMNVNTMYLLIMQELNKIHIRQLIIWECTIRKMKKNDDYKVRIVQEIEDFILSKNDFYESE